ncbi:MAG TPA: SCO4226 family nickel-binding protein [Actinomycetota bacterium]|nr:SCO4226 family nickel-binding protein [Actinomycetota bacterium]
MPTYMDVHSGFVGVSAEDFQAAHEADLAIQDEEGARYERAWLDPETGTAFCLITGPSREAVLRVHERAGHPADELYELAVEV